MKITSRKISKQKKVAITLLISSIIGAGLLMAWVYTSGLEVARDNQPIDYSPATKEDKALNDAHKAKLGAEPSGQTPSNTTPASGDTKKQVTPTITAYGQPAGPSSEFKLNGFVPGIIESDGTCTLTLTKGETVVTVDKGALQNAQNTSCGQLVVPFEKLSTGTWQAVLSYESSMSSGPSATTQVEIK
jgi:hypothetical protein